MSHKEAELAKDFYCCVEGSSASQSAPHRRLVDLRVRQYKDAPSGRRGYAFIDDRLRLSTAGDRETDAVHLKKSIACTM
jgi:hypothetical protein